MDLKCIHKNNLLILSINNNFSNYKHYETLFLLILSFLFILLLFIYLFIYYYIKL